VTPIRRLLIANRGEIARRVIRTASEMGIPTVAVFVDADADAPFVGEADEAVRLPGSYLDIAAMIDAARRTRADAVHPGYGFLSENAGFARAVVDAGLVWVGPPPDAIEAMGDKLTAKRLAEEAGVPTLPSSDDPTAGDEVGFPLLVKASAGGGGKGMRLVERADDLAESVAAARREALSGFGDDTVFLERYLQRARHVEIQLLGDHHGNLVHLGERECSIQRRHQKIVEESPSPAVDTTMRDAMGRAAVDLGRSIGYASAGTVEFLVDDERREFFFLEVNTRLQVEHAVTEEVTGIDLVREQLRIAMGQTLGCTQDDVSFHGHAIEVRLYAEDPAAGFLPATGTLHAFEPAASPAVRWDSGVEQGSLVGTSFDPMLAKVIAHAPTRLEAAGALALALERTCLGGVTTNRDFLAATLRHPAFLAGDTTTDFLERVAPLGDRADTYEVEIDLVTVAAAMWLQGRNRADAPTLASFPSGWRNARMPFQRVELSPGDDPVTTVEYRSLRDGSFVLADGRTVLVHDWSPRHIELEVDGRRRVVAVTHRRSPLGETLFVQGASTTVALDVVPRFPLPDAGVPTGGLVAPMPGAVLDVRVAVGDSVVTGQTLVVLEAMKMEHHISAPLDGVVGECRVTVGEHVDNGATLLVIEPIDDPEA
jgi:propionyl-CoA carboxylase alpha chain